MSLNVDVTRAIAIAVCCFLITAILSGTSSNHILFIVSASAKSSHHHQQKSSNNQQQQGSCPDGSQPDSNGNCPTPTPSSSTSQQQICPDGSTPDSNGNCPTNNNSPSSPLQTPSCPDGSQPDANGTCSTNQQRNQISPPSLSSTTSFQHPLTSLAPPSQQLPTPTNTSSSNSTTSSMPSSSSQAPLTNLIPQPQRLTPGVSSTPIPTSGCGPGTDNSTCRTTIFAPPLISKTQSLPLIRTNSTTIPRITSGNSSSNLTNNTTPTPIAGNQTAANTTMQTFYVYIHINNSGGGTKTIKDVTVSFPSILKGSPCGISGQDSSFPVTPDTFPGSETGTPVKVSAAANFCAPPGSNLDFNGYQPQIGSDCDLIPQSGACHITLNYYGGSTATTTTNKTIGAAPPTTTNTTTFAHSGTTKTNTGPTKTTNTNTNKNTNTNVNSNTKTNINTNNNINTNTNANTNTNTILNKQTIQNTVKINNEVNNVIRSTSQAAASTATTTITSPSSKGPLVDLETIRLGKSTFPSGGIRPLADVTPFQIIGGHVSINSPNPNVNIIVAQITDSGVQHAVILDLKKTAAGIPGETLYHTDLGQIITGTNPFSGKIDTISHITDLLLYNNSVSSLQLNDDSELTMTIIYR